MSFNKNGIVSDNFQQIIEYDNQYWLCLMWHNLYDSNGNFQLFTSTNAANCDLPGLYSRLCDIDNYKYSDNKYYFMAINDGVRYRWSQTNAPLSSTVVSGYTAIEGSPSGLCKCSGNTLLARSNSTGNWWNACGCWTQYGTKTIPGIGGVATKEYLTLYVRIDNKVSIAKNSYLIANDIMED